MAYPVVIDPTVPAQSENPSLGASRIRAIEQALLDLFNLPASTNIATALTITRIGPLTNNSGLTLNAGDVVTLDAGNDQSVILDDVLSSQRPFVVALATIANTATGVFGQSGMTTVAVQGAVTRGRYLIKSATSKALQDSGIVMASASALPTGALGVALTAAAGPGAGTVIAQLFGTFGLVPLQIGSYSVRGLSGSASVLTATFSADQVVVRNPTTGVTVVKSNTGTLTCNLGVSGAGGIDTGAVAPSTWYHIYIIYNLTTDTLQTVGSLVAPPTGPQLPTGYTMWAYVHALRVGGATTIAGVYLRGAWALLQNHLNVVNAGAPGVGVETTVSVSAAIPPNALAYLIDSNFQVTGSLVSGFFFTIRAFTGIDSAAMRGIVPANTQTGAVSSSTPLPNVSQQFYYLWTIDSGVGSAPSANIYVQGYTVGNGDS